MQIAKQYVRENPDFAGVVTVEGQTPRGRGGRLGTKTTSYHYNCVDGVVTKTNLGAIIRGEVTQSERVTLKKEDYQ